MSQRPINEYFITAPDRDDLYWRPDSKGYTISLLHAGLYTKEKAESIVNGKRGDKMIHITEFKESIKEDYRLARRLLGKLERNLVKNS